MMMFGFGWLIMLLVIGIPLLLIILVISGSAVWRQNRDRILPVSQNQVSAYQPRISQTPGAAPAARYCAHCGAGLQSDWSHCPQCGAPIP